MSRATTDIRTSAKWSKIAGSKVKAYRKSNGLLFATGSQEACEILSAEFKGFARKVAQDEKTGDWWFRLNPKSVVWE